MSKYDPQFSLKHPHGEKPSEIRLRVYFNSQEVVYNLVDPVTEEVYKILPKLWDKINKRPVLATSIPRSLRHETANVRAIDAFMKKVIGVCAEIKEYVRVNQIAVTPEYWKEQVKIRLGFKVEKKVEEMTVSQFTKDVISEMEQGELLIPKTKEKYSSGTITSYRYFLNMLEMFDVIRGKVTYFNSIDNDWYDDFIRFLTFEVEYVEFDFYKEDLSPNTIGKHVKNLKMLMGLALSRGVSTSIEHTKKYFIKPKEDAFAVYLTEEELRKIYDVELSGENAVLDKYRDMFLIGCYTALRVSDYKKIDCSCFTTTAEGTRVIDMPTQKTKNRVTIPIVYDELIAIAEKYNYDFPCITSQKLNDAIKEIARLAGITNPVTYFATKGGETRQFTEPKYKLISSHTGRRSAATNLYNIYDIPAYNLMLITGHKSIDNFMKYIKIAREENADKISKRVKEKKDGK